MEAFPEITVQTYVKGRPANAMFACSEGKVLSSLSVDVLFSHEELGAATIVRTGPNAEMERAGQILVKALGISGFCGLDFIREQNTGKAYLIELNPRATQLGHLKPGGRASLVEVLVRHLRREPLIHERTCARESIAFFPQATGQMPEDPALANANLVQDIPWSAPGLVRELNRTPWNRRHFSAFAYIAVERFAKRRTQQALRKVDKLRGAGDS